MVIKLTALISVLAICYLLVPLLAEADPFPTDPVSIKFSQASYGEGDAAVIFVHDANLSPPSHCDADWTDTRFAVDALGWWDLATGSPNEEYYALSPGCEYDIAVPSRTPLTPPGPDWSAEANGVGVLVGNYDPVLGLIALGFDVHASSTVHVLFEFDEVNNYPATSTVARIYSDSDLAGEPVALGEVSSELDSTPSPTSSLFSGSVLVSSNPASQALGDGKVWVRYGDSLHVDYLGTEPGASPITSASASLDLAPPTPTPTPVPASSSISLAVMGAALIVLTVWQMTRRRAQ